MQILQEQKSAQGFYNSLSRKAAKKTRIFSRGDAENAGAYSKNTRKNEMNFVFLFFAPLREQSYKVVAALRAYLYSK